MLNFLRLGKNLPTNLSREYWHFILAFSVEFFLSFTTLRCLYAYLCFHLQYLHFRFPFLKFWKKVIFLFAKRIKPESGNKHFEQPIWIEIILGESFIDCLDFEPMNPYHVDHMIWLIWYGPCHMAHDIGHAGMVLVVEIFGLVINYYRSPTIETLHISRVKVRWEQNKFFVMFWMLYIDYFYKRQNPTVWMRT